MRKLSVIVGYVISDPAGLYPDKPEFGVGCLAEARAEADALYDDFADELDGGNYVVMTLYSDGRAEATG